MSLYIHETADQLPFLQVAAGLRFEECTHVELLALMGSITVEEVNNRIANHHVAFAAYINNVPAAFGWMARNKAKIGELNHEMILPIGNRYLWNFRTMQAFRGLGIYPALLQYIIQSESAIANRFWIIHAPENKSSLKGIIKAGFHYVGKLYSYKGKPAIENTYLSNNYRKVLAEMDMVLSKEEPASCWNCSNPHLKKRKMDCCCSPISNECIGYNLLSFAS